MIQQEYLRLDGLHVPSLCEALKAGIQRRNIGSFFGALFVHGRFSAFRTACRVDSLAEVLILKSLLLQLENLQQLVVQVQLMLLLHGLLHSAHEKVVLGLRLIHLAKRTVENFTFLVFCFDVAFSLMAVIFLLRST